MADWGANYYFKGVLLGQKPSDDLNPKTFDRILDIASSKDHRVAVLLEYLPHTKINSISASATPYRRDLPGNALILAQWGEGTPEANQKAKDMVHAIADIMPKGEGYGNYGESPHWSVRDEFSFTRNRLAPDSDALPVVGALPSDKSKALFRDAYPRLQAVKKRYDPDTVFNQWYTVIPA